MRLPAAAFAALTALASPALAGPQDFTLVNRTGYPIDSVYVSQASASSWGGDIMGRDTLDDGGKVDINFNASARGCHYDLKVKYSDNDTSEWHDIDLCTISRISLFWDRKAGTTRAMVE